MKPVAALVGLAVAILVFGLVVTAIKVLSVIALLVLVLALAYYYRDAKGRK